MYVRTYVNTYVNFLTQLYVYMKCTTDYSVQQIAVYNRMQCTTECSVQQNAVYNRYIALSVHEHSIELPTYVLVDESLIATLGAANSLVCSTHTYIHTYR